MKNSKSSFVAKERAAKVNETYDLANLSFETKSGKTLVKSIPVIVFKVEEPYLKIQVELPLSPSLLFSIQHKHLQTLVDLSHLSHLYLLGFDEQLKFIGVSIIGEKSGSPYQLLNQGKYFLLMNQEKGIDFSGLSKLTLLPSKVNYRDLEELTNEQLVERYNKECGNRGWTSSRGSFLIKLQKALESRNLDISEITKGGGLNLKAFSKCKLVGNKLVPILL